MILLIYSFCQNKFRKKLGAVIIGVRHGNIVKASVVRMIREIAAFIEIAAQNGAGLMAVGGQIFLDIRHGNAVIDLPTVVIDLRFDPQGINVGGIDQHRVPTVIRHRAIGGTIGIDLDVDVARIGLCGVLHKDLHAAVLTNERIVRSLDGAQIGLIGYKMHVKAALIPRNRHLCFGTRRKILFHG